MKLPALTLKPQQALAAAALIAPVVLVQAARLIGGSTGPAASLAATTGDAPTPPAPPPIPTPRLDAQQAKALAWLRTNSNLVVVASPFARPSAGAPTVKAAEPVTVDPVSPQAELPEEVQRLSLSAMVTGGGGTCALMSGKVYRQGDAVVEGWTVTTIDAEGRKVVVTGPAGTAVEVRQSH